MVRVNTGAKSRRRSTGLQLALAGDGVQRLGQAPDVRRRDASDGDAAIARQVAACVSDADAKPAHM